MVDYSGVSLVPNYTTPSGNLPVPIAAEVQGVRTYPNKTQYQFHHVYQYINFEPYVDDPESVFNVSSVYLSVTCVYLRSASLVCS